MRVFMSVDMEGITSTAKWDECNPDEKDDIFFIIKLY
ncbi:D-aminopeptidase [Tissierella praeacuta]|nr:M55 family metallopeptidase [Tissierella praeacuta]TCU71689.1 D-aminopeptidase-like protein [Tissierella praeacuta]SUP01053.1 D-aminopeptidase [Tissierella praeacuta]